MNPFAWLDESFSIRLVQTLVHFLWQGIVIAIIAKGAERIFQGSSARSKYMTHVVALLAMTCCLPTTFALIGSPREFQEEPAIGHSLLRGGRIEGAAVDVLLSERQKEHRASGGNAGLPMNNESLSPNRGEQTHLPSTIAADASTTQPRYETAELALTHAAPGHSLAWLSTLAPYLTIAYLTCVTTLLSRLATGVWSGHALRTATSTVASTDLLTRISQQAQQIGLRVVPVVAYCQRVSVPVVVGIVRPTILLPATLASGLPPHQLESLILHELAHVRRWDPLVNLLQRLVEAILFFHPAVWYVNRRIDIERENACDDMVLAAGWQRLQYADALVHMAELAAWPHRLEATPYLAALAASGGNPTEFKRRVMRLLEPQPTHFRLSNVGLTIFVTLVALVIAVPFSVRTWAQQDSDAEKETALASASGDELGRRIENFRLRDFFGGEHSLSEFADRDIVVVAFLGIECPVSKLYGPRLQTIAERYKSKSVAVLGIDSNQQDTPTELAHYARSHGITVPLLKDPSNLIADQFRAERTPEAFVLDRDRTVRYWGRIDDQFGVGYSRHEAKQNYVTDAIDNLLAGRPVRVSHVNSTGCHIGRVSRAAPTGEITYAKQISRIVQRRCVECHREGGIAPFALDSYETVAAWAETIREVVAEGRMPPWHASAKFGHFANEARMSDAEKELLSTWVANGVPRGADGDLPPQREFVDGWALGPPDLLLTVPTPIKVPATGVVEYQYVSVDPGLTEGKWIRASEVRPGVRTVVHHIVVFINPPGGDPILKDRGIGFETAGIYVPGSAPMQLETGVARYVPPGSTFVFQIHYTPDGTERQDQSQIGLYFADPATVRRTMQMGVAANLDFEIPPQSDDYLVEATHRFSHDMEIYTLAPHMHYRGKSFRVEADYPNGSREVLLDVPRYDFNWQHTYKFAKPRFMPEGTLLRCTARFDNSEHNIANPDPEAAVRWGEQTWQEMMIGYFEGVFLNQDLSLPPPRIDAIAGDKYVAHFAYRPDRAAQSVNVAGTFNEWSNSSHPMTDPDGDGVYTADVQLNAGPYRYKFVLDGDYWTHDPSSRILTGFLHESFFVAGVGQTPRTGE
jgi:beta-lactamase regulating signal transducer with metallopeptidase domain/peroxiredoxin/mono/diheme cytochrome c family protein